MNPATQGGPAAHAQFDEFADRTLNFTLRVYLASRDVFQQLRHELLTVIAREFGRVGIEIAFPQCDIHIRSTVPSSFPAEQNALEAATIPAAGQLAQHRPRISQ